MENWKHYVSTGHSISEKYYGREQMKLAGTGQGNKFLWDMCRDTPCLIIRQLEKERLGMVIKSLHAAKKHQKVSALFVDDTNLVTDGELVEKNM